MPLPPFAPKKGEKTETTWKALWLAFPSLHGFSHYPVAHMSEQAPFLFFLSCLATRRLRFSSLLSRAVTLES